MAIAIYNGEATEYEFTSKWATTFIGLLWKFIPAMWASRNSILHGDTGKETACHKLQEFQSQTMDHYMAFLSNQSYIVPPRGCSWSLGKRSLHWH
jgi:hypothetical protein